MYRGNVFVALFIVDWNKAGGVRRQAGKKAGRVITGSA